MKSGLEFQNALRIVNCMEREDFIDCFGVGGDYIWTKFVDSFRKDIFELICYLDTSNIELLYKYVCKKNEKQMAKIYYGGRFLEFFNEFEKEYFTEKK